MSQQMEEVGWIPSSVPKSGNWGGRSSGSRAGRRFDSSAPMLPAPRQIPCDKCGHKTGKAL